MKKLEKLMDTQDFMEAASACNTLEDLQKLLAEQGLELTVEELTALIAPVAVGADGELSEEALDNVAGGGRFIDWLYNKLFNRNTRELEKLWKY